jgi:Tfp pilus assembly protein PilO
MVTRIKDWRRYDVDLAGVGLLILIAVVGYPLAIHSALSDVLRYEQARRQRDEASAALASLRAQCASAKRQIEESRHRLTTVGSRLPDPHAVDGMISRLQKLTSQCGIVLARLQPAGTAENDGYQASTFQIAGKGTFPALQRWFARIESDVPYLDITHFVIRATNEKDKGEKTLCLFECTQKLYLSCRSVGSTALAKQP